MCLSVLLTSCTMENIVSEPDRQEVVISLAAGTRATADGDAQDSQIGSLRVLGYHTSNLKLAFNEKINTGSAKPYKINVKTGTYLMVFIANEHTDPALSAQLDGITPESNPTLAYLRGQVYFRSSAFATNKDIPMVAFRENILIEGDDKLVENNALASVPWKVALDRLAIRMDLTLKMPAAQFDAWYGASGNKQIRFSHFPSRVYLFPKTSNEAYIDDTGLTVTYAGANPTAVDGLKSIQLNRAVILPESYFTPVGNKDNGLLMSLTDNIGQRKGTISSGEASWGYTLPRNTYLGITATLAGPVEQEFDFTVTVVNWSDESLPWEVN
ncbi:hypothetical protein LJB87_01440 [Alistipes sp. OttesenSCG-928-L06]|nr:hypothetical protein [Alistipes sp. OttesenSCG-928-L06]